MEQARARLSVGRVTATRVLRRVVLVGALTLLSGCILGENEQFFSSRPRTLVTLPGAREDRFEISLGSAPKIDVLFCIDDSASMSDNQQILAGAFRGFIQQFFLAGLDFHIGIVTSDVDSDRGLLQSRWPSEPFLKTDTTDLIAKFEENARVGTSGSYREQCLQAFIQSMEPGRVGPGGRNEGFFRNDSLLSFVVVSDENEDIQNGESVSDRVSRLKDSLRPLKGPSSTGARFDFIINEQAPDPGRVLSPGSVQFYPGRYYEASRLLFGRNYDISRDFSQDLLRISEGMVRQASREFTLSERPRDSSMIEALLNGNLLIQGDSNGFLYHPDRNSVELQGMAAASAAGTLLQVFY